jgi:hypothetical protein
MLPLYKVLARTVGSYHRCSSPKANYFQKNNTTLHEDTICFLVENHLPRGAGFDNGTAIDLNKSSEEKLVFQTSFHHMDDNGCYDIWTKHTVVVKPSLAYGFLITIGGKNHKDIKSLIQDCFEATLSEKVAEF